jgi:hypothetical protein
MQANSMDTVEVKIRDSLQGLFSFKSYILHSPSYQVPLFQFLLIEQLVEEKHIGSSFTVVYPELLHALLYSEVFHLLHFNSLVTLSTINKLSHHSLFDYICNNVLFQLTPQVPFVHYKPKVVCTSDLFDYPVHGPRSKVQLEQLQTTNNIQHTTNNIQQTTYNIQHTTYNIQHTTYNIQHTTYNIQHTTFNIQHTTTTDSFLTKFLKDNVSSKHHSLAVWTKL